MNELVYNEVNGVMVVASPTFTGEVTLVEPKTNDVICTFTEQVQAMTVPQYRRLGPEVQSLYNELADADKYQKMLVVKNNTFVVLGARVKGTDIIFDLWIDGEKKHHRLSMETLYVDTFNLEEDSPTKRWEDLDMIYNRLLDTLLKSMQKMENDKLKYVNTLSDNMLKEILIMASRNSNASIHLYSGVIGCWDFSCTFLGQEYRSLEGYKTAMSKL